MARMTISPPPPKGWAHWEELMNLALDEAQQAKNVHEVPVGALVVHQQGHILGRGHNQSIQTCDPTAHAEMQALRAAAKNIGNYRLEHCYMVVTLEPCIMCAGAIAHARIAGVVYGALDKAAGALLSRLDVLDQSIVQRSIWHMGGVCEAACSALLQDFFQARR